MGISFRQDILCCWAAMVVVGLAGTGVLLAQNRPQEDASPQVAEDSSAPAQEIQVPPIPDLSIPPDASVEQLQALVGKARAIRPRSPQQYQAMQTAIRDASKRILEQLKDAPSSAAYRQAELDRISASVMLMTFFGQDAQQKTMNQLHQFLKGREQLNLSDIQTGMMAAAMLELQPNKQPALQTYQLLDDLLADDERREMQALRINLKSNVSRLALLGNKMVLAAQTIDGDELSIESYTGKFLIVNFFAIQLTEGEKCTACLEELTRLKKYYERYHDKGLEIIGINLDTDISLVEAYRQSEKLPWPIIHDQADKPLESLRLKFGISQLPTVFLLNKEGTVVSLEARGAELDRLMEMLFERPTPAPMPETGTKNPEAADGQADTNSQDGSA